jgi:hypothetical protein
VLKILTNVHSERKLADLTVTENDPFEERAVINKRKKAIEAALEGKSISKKKKKRKLVDSKSDETINAKSD